MLSMRLNSAAYAEMAKAIKKREEFFNKEIAGFKKAEAVLVKKIENMDKD